MISVGATYDSDFARAPQAGTFPLVSCYDTSPTMGQIACFSSRVPGLDFVAPGYLIQSCQLGGGSTQDFGTSLAAAHVTGALALLQSGVNKWTPADRLIDALKKTADPAPDPEEPSTTYPAINVWRAVTEGGLNQAEGWEFFQ